MSYCTKCGAEISDEAVICVHCGCETQKSKNVKKDNDTAKTLILVFLILGCIAGASAFLIPLAWCVPITLSIKNKMDSNEPIDTGLKICALIFVNMVAGILLLCLYNE